MAVVEELESVETEDRHCSPTGGQNTEPAPLTELPLIELPSDRLLFIASRPMAAAWAL